ncbi:MULTISPECIES: hypothetical protein [unclassified Bordetella]|uniref:hypothetical protein n=1 Tax=unclassified Bordetella TaxID=2630031 RepID=UPI001323682E|nr:MULTISPECIES: hypothetical protein [unclassified Bordetella]MVW71234.1 hypothetical protein [Bordetella sp. 15P40C-2]MVW80428.1 hypothetical protein [Bordetella sp. 02P26C-1]
MQIDALLPLYPDDASRRQLLTQALAQTRSDITALARARSMQDHDAALQAVHRAKGTASFLGGDETALRHFDELTRLIKLAQQVSQRPSTLSSGGTRTVSTSAVSVDDSAVLAAYARVESVLRELESKLQSLMAPYRGH